MTKVILTRHGETQWNLEGRVQGAQDSPLTSKGILQAERLAARLGEYGISRLFSSDLPRAIQTAKVIQQTLEIPDITFSQSLRELSFGEWEGIIWRELRQQYPEIFAKWDSGPHQVEIPGGETMEFVTKRAWDYINQMADQYSNEVLCFVTHGMTLQLLVKKALGYPLEKWDDIPWQHNTALNIFDINSNKDVNIVCLADCSHLEE